MSEIHRGGLRKMRIEPGQPADYFLRLGGGEVPLKNYLGNTLTLTYHGAIHCVSCGRKTRKSFAQGYCYPCFRDLPECDMCIVKPEQCHFEQGTCRDDAWGLAHCFQPHHVYLANSSGLKVGITRESQIPTRWLDQGAAQALPIMRVASRHISGLVEVALKSHVADRTDWRAMLKGEPEPVDLAEHRDRLLAEVADDIASLRQRFGADALQLESGETHEFNYPVLEYPVKIKALNFDKQPEIAGTLQGIKGQYLMFDSGVINLRKFAGYEVSAG